MVSISLKAVRRIVKINFKPNKSNLPFTFLFLFQDIWQYLIIFITKTCFEESEQVHRQKQFAWKFSATKFLIFNVTSTILYFNLLQWRCWQPMVGPRVCSLCKESPGNVSSRERVLLSLCVEAFAIRILYLISVFSAECLISFNLRFNSLLLLL